MKKNIENIFSGNKIFKDFISTTKNILKNREAVLKLAKYGLFIFFLLLIPSNFAHAGWFGDLIMDITSFAVGSIANIAAQVLSWLLEWVWIPILSWVLTVMGNLLDQSINFSLDMTNISTIEGIKIGWKIVRDLVNMVFIFILLYIAISTILDTAGAASKKTLANLVIAIILINFSYFIAGLIIDAGNILALTFRGAIITEGTDGGLGAIVMNAMKLSEAYEPSGLGYSSFISAAVRSILMCVTIYAFFLASMLFIVRIISFILLLVLSPIGFIGNLSPKFAEQSKKWWSTLINQTLVAPIFLFFFYIIAKISVSDKLFKNTIEGTANLDVTYYFNFAIIIGLILTAVKLSKQFSGELGGKVAGFAGTLGKMALGAAGAMTVGGLAMAGRGVVGRGATAILSKAGEGLSEAGSKGGIGGFGARLALKGLKGTEKASFDVRGTETGKKILGLAKGISFGKAGGSGGFKETIKETAREERKSMGEMFGTNEVQKERYAKEVLQKPLWTKVLQKTLSTKVLPESLRMEEIKPNSLLGKMSKKVQAGVMIEKESGIRIELASEIKDLKNYMEQLKPGNTLTPDEKAEIKTKMKDIRENIGYLKEDLKEAAGEAKKKD